MRLQGTSVVFNESGADTDFRVESSTNTHALFVDAGNNTVGVGTSSVSSTVAANFHGKGILFRNNVNGDNTNYTRLHNTASTDRSNLLIQPATGSVEITQGGGLTVANTAGYGTIFNTDGVDADFRVESESAAYMLFVDASANAIGINSSNPDSGRYLHIEGGGTGIGITLKDTGSPGTQYGIYSEGSSLYFDNDSNSSSPLIILNSGDLRTLGDNSTEQALQFRTSSTAGRAVIKSVSRTDSGSVNPMSELQLMGYGTSNYLGQFKVVLNSSDTYNSTNQNNIADFKGTGGLVLNESGLSYLDFRVESTSYTNMLYVDAGTNQVLINGATGAGVLSIDKTSHAQAIGLNVVDTESGNSTETLLNLTNNSDQDVQFKISQVGATTKSAYIGPSTNTQLNLTGAQVGLLNRDLYLDSASLVVNQDSRDYDFRVESDNNANMLTVDAGYDQVLFGTTTTRANSSGLQKPNIVSGASIAGQSLDGSATFNTAGYQFGNSLSTTKTVQIYPGSGVYGFLEVHVAGYNSSGSGATHALFHAGGHTGNATLYNIQELYRYNYGNLTTSAATVTGGRLEFTVATSGTGSTGVTVISIKSMDSGAVIPRIVVT